MAWFLVVSKQNIEKHKKKQIFIYRNPGDQVVPGPIVHFPVHTPLEVTAVLAAPTSSTTATARTSAWTGLASSALWR